MGGDDDDPGVGRDCAAPAIAASDEQTVFVGGINWKANEGDLLEFFNDAIGPALHCRIITDRETNRSKGYGFVTFANADLARDAKLQDPPLIFMGKTLNCQSAYRRVPTSLMSRVTRPITPSPVYFSPMYCDANGYFYVVQSDGYGWYPPHGPYYSSPPLPPAQNALPYPTGGAIADRIQDCSPLPGSHAERFGFREKASDRMIGDNGSPPPGGKQEKTAQTCHDPEPN